MSGISSNVGLISGLPTADLIRQLMAIEARPVTLLQQRAAVVTTQRTALADLSARLLKLQNQVQPFDRASFFRVFRATSSNENVLTAVAGEDALPGTFTFQVRSLVSSHALVGQGFADANATPVGAGTITLELGHGRVDSSTPLELLNGGAGVRRGRIEITDRTGRTAQVDLTAALTIDDVLEAINGQTAVSVRAGVSGDRLVMEDLNGSTAAGSLSVRDLSGRHAAEDLGIAGTASAGAGEPLALQGADVINLADGTLLSALNDGNGVDRAVAGADFSIVPATGGQFDISLSGNIDATTRLEVLNSGQGVRLGVIRVTDRKGQSAEVNLAGVTSLGEAVTAIEEQTAAAGMTISVTYFNSSNKHALQISDGSGGTSGLMIEDVSGFAARDLGVAATAEGSTLIGNGIHRINTVGDVRRAIQYAYDAVSKTYNEGRIAANFTAGGNGLQLTGSGVTPDFQVVAANNSTAADDLGIAGNYVGGGPSAETGRDLLAGLNTVLLHSLRGGSGVGVGAIDINGVTIDLAGPTPVQTLGQLLERISAQADATGVSASVSETGLGIELRHESGGDIVVQDLAGGTTAADLGIAGTHAGGSVNGGNLQLQYISGRTRLADLNGGRGVRTGQFRIVDAAGATYTVNLTTNQSTGGDVIRLIKAAAPTVTASINATGDGILLTDTSGGAGQLKVEAVSGSSTAADLNLDGEAVAGETTIDGSFEIHVTIDADDTLNNVASKINAAKADVSAAVINDGTGIAPYRLTLHSQVSGTHGRIVFDGGDTGLDLNTLVEARDAVVFLGGADAENPILLRSNSNTLTGAIPGVTLNLLGTSDQPVDLSVTQDVDRMVEDLRGFVDAYNDVVSRIDQQTSFDAETLKRGVLFGDATVNVVETRLFRAVTQSYGEGSQALLRLSSVGLTLGEGGRLSLNEEKFREAYAKDPESVEQLFTTDETGFGAAFEDTLDELTRSSDGLLARRDSALQNNIDLLNDRIASMQELLDRKQARLERQFQGLEQSLAALQNQQTALGALQNLLLGSR